MYHLVISHFFGCYVLDTVYDRLRGTDVLNPQCNNLREPVNVHLKKYILKNPVFPH